MRLFKFIAISLGLLVPAVAHAEPVSYQGQFTDNGAVPSGDYDIRFRIFGTVSGGSPIGAAVTRTVALSPDDGGLFSFTDLDFGAGVFTGAPRWIEVAVKPSADANFTLLSPRQQISAVPYANFAFDSSTTLDDAFQNGNTISNSGGAPARITGALELGNASSSGALVLYQSGSPAPVLQLFNLAGNGGSIRLRDESGADISRLEADPQGTGALLLLEGDGGSLSFDGDTSIGAGSGSRFSITGPASAFMFDSALAGDAALTVPASSISAAEILDEPGLAAATTAGGVGIPTSAVPATVLSRSITVPGPGYVVALANCRLVMTRPAGAQGSVFVGLSEASNTIPSTQEIVVSLPPIGVIGTYNFPASAHAVFDVPAAGTYTYYFNGRSIGFTSPQAFDTTLTLLYIPTSYGAVTPTLLEGGNSDPLNHVVTAPMSREEILAEQLAEQRRALEALEEEQAFLRAQLEEIRTKAESGR